MTFPPPPLPPPPNVGAPTEVATRVVIALAIGVMMLGVGLFAGYLAFSNGDDETAEAPTTSVRDPDEIDPESGLSDRDVDEGSDNLLEGDLSDEIIDAAEESFWDEVQATLTFFDDATPRQVERVVQAWEDTPLLRGVLFIDAEEMEAAAGIDAASVTGWGATDDEAAIRRFVCRFSDDAGVSVVGTGDMPC